MRQRLSLVDISAALEPGADEARRWLRQELLHPEYRGGDLLDRLLRWFDALLSGAAEASGAATAAAVLVGLTLLLALLWLVTRTRTAGRTSSAPGPVLADHVHTAAHWRAKAHEAFAAGRFADAVVDGFRTVAAEAAEAGRLELRPGVTAREVAEALVAEPRVAEALVAEPQGADDSGSDPGRLREGADLFDRVRYGARPASRDQAASVLALDPRAGVTQ